MDEQSSRIGELLSTVTATGVGTFEANAQAMHDVIEKLTEELDGGVSAHFAKRIGMRKSTVHNWKTQRSALTFDALTRVSIHCNVSLTQLVQGNLEHWQPPLECRQLALGLAYPTTPKNREHRKHNWDLIRSKLRAELESPHIRSLAVIASELDIDDRYLYMQVTDEARMLGERYVKYLHRIARQKEQEQMSALTQAAQAISGEGEFVTVPLVTERLGKAAVNSIRGLYTTVSVINAGLRAANEEN